jgi:hypothetical protein
MAKNLREVIAQVESGQINKWYGPTHGSLGRVEDGEKQLCINENKYMHNWPLSSTGIKTFTVRQKNWKACGGRGDLATRCGYLRKWVGPN